MKTLPKVLKTIRDEIGPLSKDDRNAHFKFSYVPIDDFYEKVASVALKHGLVWRLYEADAVSTAANMLVIPYRVDLFWADDWHEWDRITIMHPAQGAQTAGAARSYAEKIFMRHLFKIVTGEADSDGTAGIVADNTPIVMDQPTKGHVGEPDEAPVGQIPPEAVKRVVDRIEGKVSPIFKRRVSDADKELVYQVFQKFMPLQKSVKDLAEWRKMNADVMDLFQEEDAVLYARITKLFTKRKGEVKNDTV